MQRLTPQKPQQTDSIDAPLTAKEINEKEKEAEQIVAASEMVTLTELQQLEQDILQLRKAIEDKYRNDTVKLGLRLAEFKKIEDAIKLTKTLNNASDNEKIELIAAAMLIVRNTIQNNEINGIVNSTYNLLRRYSETDNVVLNGIKSILGTPEKADEERAIKKYNLLQNYLKLTNANSDLQAVKEWALDTHEFDTNLNSLFLTRLRMNAELATLKPDSLKKPDEANVRDKSDARIVSENLMDSIETFKWKAKPLAEVTTLDKTMPLDILKKMVQDEENSRVAEHIRDRSVEDFKQMSINAMRNEQLRSFSSASLKKPDAVSDRSSPVMNDETTRFEKIKKVTGNKRMSFQRFLEKEKRTAEMRMFDRSRLRSVTPPEVKLHATAEQEEAVTSTPSPRLTRK